MNIELKGWICMDVESATDPKPRFVFFSHKPNGETYTPVCKHTISADLGDFDPRPLAVAALDAQITATRAEFTRRITELQEQKSRLLAIENTVDAQ